MATCVKHPDVVLDVIGGILQPCPVCIYEMERDLRPLDDVVPFFDLLKDGPNYGPVDTFSPLKRH